MGIELIMTAVMATAVGSGCSWAHPGANPYRGNPTAVLADFPMAGDTRRQLRALMDKHQYTDVVTITRDDIVGKSRYTDLRMMHSGHGSVCHGGVDRSSWTATQEERGLVYCVGDTCVIVPTVCNNVSLVTRRPEQAAADEGPLDISPAAGPPVVAPSMPEVVATGIPDTGPLDFLPPPAGGIVDVPPTGGGGFLPPPPTPGGCCYIGPGTPVIVVPPTAVPEVPTGWLLLAGLGAIVGLRRLRA